MKRGVGGGGEKGSEVAGKQRRRGQTSAGYTRRDLSRVCFGMRRKRIYGAMHPCLSGRYGSPFMQRNDTVRSNCTRYFARNPAEPRLIVCDNFCQRGREENRLGRRTASRIAAGSTRARSQRHRRGDRSPLGTRLVFFSFGALFFPVAFFFFFSFNLHFGSRQRSYNVSPAANCTGTNA